MLHWVKLVSTSRNYMFQFILLDEFLGEFTAITLFSAPFWTFGQNVITFIFMEIGIYKTKKFVALEELSRIVIK